MRQGGKTNMPSWANKKGADISVQMPYDKPYENDEMTTDYERLNLPKPPNTDEQMRKVQEIELDLIQGFK